MRPEERTGGPPARLLTILLYCLPAILALTLVLAGYKLRTDAVGAEIEFHVDIVHAAADRAAPVVVDLLAESSSFRQIHGALERREALQRGMGGEAIPDVDVSATVLGVWLRNSVITALLVLLPYYILGRHLACARNLPLSLAERRGITRRSWWVKFLVGLVMATGWLYVLNPLGRGATTIAEFLASIDLGQTDTLPLFVEPAGAIPVTVAGFLGWYLHLLSYFFLKLSHDDVVSARVYGFLFRKFLFVYGLSLLLSAVPLATEGQMALFVFFIGYFPLSAISLIKEAGVKAAQGMQPEPGALSELPGIGRMQILRLEEEGVENISSLAYANLDELRLNMPAMASLVDFWVDVAQLYTIVGNEQYAKLEGLCASAGHFVAMADDPAFVEAVTSRGVGDPAEIVALLQRTFGSRLHVAQG